MTLKQLSWQFPMLISRLYAEHVWNALLMLILCNQPLAAETSWKVIRVRTRILIIKEWKQGAGASVAIGVQLAIIINILILFTALHSVCTCVCFLYRVYTHTFKPRMLVCSTKEHFLGHLFGLIQFESIRKLNRQERQTEGRFKTQSQIIL